jgi:glutamine synthetase
MIVLNTIMADQLIQFKKDVDTRINGGDAKDEAILKELQKLITHSKKIRFEGNGYGEEWVTEALSRGLSNLKDTPRALKVWDDKKVIRLFDEMGVLSPRELEARKEIEFENYILKIQIESRLMGDIVQNYFIPAAVTYQNKLIENVNGLLKIFGDKEGRVIAKAQMELLEKISGHINSMKSASDKMLVQRKLANKESHAEQKALSYCDNVKVHFDEIRYHADKLELLVEDELWPLPKFREMLFTR